MMFPIKKSITVNNCEFILRENNRLYGKGSGYVITTLNTDFKISINPNNETEIELCVKDISKTSEVSFYCTDTRDNTYDVFVTNTYNKTNLLYFFVLYH